MRMMQDTLSPGRQRGAALVVGLIFLSMLSLMAVAAYMVATQEERMAGNTRDRLRAFEAAEASLRDCESLLRPGAPWPPVNRDGMYDAPAFGSAQVYETVDWLDDSLVRSLPQVGGADAIPDVARQPRCIVERIGEIEVRRLADERSGPMEVTVETIFRITAMGYGTNINTTVNLQTMFRRE
jgi:type IV pilus assembly protein PilX